MALLSAGLSLAIALSQAGSKPDPVGHYVRAEMKRLQIPEVVYAVVKNGEVARSEALGFSDMEAKRAAKIDDLFEIGSMTKQFTAMAALMLAEEYKLNLDDPVSKYLTDAPAPWSAITVRNLLNQDSGLPDYAFVPGVGLKDNFTREKFMAAMAKQPLDFQPTEAWAYSNTNYALLGWIIETVAREPYIKFIEENILRPIGMNHTTFAVTGAPPAGLATGYVPGRRRGGTELRAVPPEIASIKSDNALISNIPDLLKWDEALSELRLMSHRAYVVGWSRVRLKSGRSRPYSMGWYLSMPGSLAYMGHGGNIAGFSAAISRFPTKRLTVLLLANLNPVSSESMAKQIAALFDPTMQHPALQPVTDPDPKRTERVKLAVEAMGAAKADSDLLESEAAVLLKTIRDRLPGPSSWRWLRTVDSMAFCGARPQDNDTVLTYRITAANRSWIALILWTSQGKLADETLYPEDDP